MIYEVDAEQVACLRQALHAHVPLVIQIIRRDRIRPSALSRYIAARMTRPSRHAHHMIKNYTIIKQIVYDTSSEYPA